MVKQQWRLVILLVVLSQMQNDLLILSGTIGGIENSLHWILNVALKEDDCQIRKDNAPQNFAVLRQIAVNLLGKENRLKRRIKNKQFLAAMDNKYLARVLALA